MTFSINIKPIFTSAKSTLIEFLIYNFIHSADATDFILFKLNTNMNLTQ